MNKKTIFITGAGRGIGKATAQFFVQKGWFVGLSDINLSEIETLAQSIGKENCSTHLVDVRNINEVQKAIDEFGKITNNRMDVLFNNAGILFSGGFEKVPLGKHKAIVDVNFTGQMNVTHLALPLLKTTPKSAIVTMCSASSLFGNPELTAYAASKSAVKSLTEGWNLLFKKHDIHVADILVSYVKTSMVSNEQSAMKLPDKDIKITADRIAEGIWKAAHSKKMHHYIGFDAKLLRIAKWLLPQSILIAILKNSFYKKALVKNWFLSFDARNKEW